ncbi:hypothetical protein ABWW58_07265 [Sporolactobacillus sp. STCC-11]|uniref:hypothetical protein n=1 Tax=Sporolactobacillus caesalpiniae TaxID=3230362 RepID=UPI0033970372
MKKIIILNVIVVCCLIMVGCSGSKDSSSVKKGVLDITHLTKENSVNKDKNLPISYEAPNTKTALEALPFTIVLPNKLPFKSKGFDTNSIEDQKHNKKNLLASFSAFSSDASERVIIAANNYNASYLTKKYKKITLNKNIIGYYQGTSLSFEYKKINYNITYANDKNPKAQKEGLISMAKQMIY